MSYWYLTKFLRYVLICMKYIDYLPKAFAIATLASTATMGTTKIPTPSSPITSVITYVALLYSKTNGGRLNDGIPELTLADKPKGTLSMERFCTQRKVNSEAKNTTRALRELLMYHKIFLIRRVVGVSFLNFICESCCKLCLKKNILVTYFFYYNKISTYS